GLSRELASSLHRDIPTGALWHLFKGNRNDTVDVYPGVPLGIGAVPVIGAVKEDLHRLSKLPVANRRGHNHIQVPVLGAHRKFPRKEPYRGLEDIEGGFFPCMVRPHVLSIRCKLKAIPGVELPALSQYLSSGLGENIEGHHHGSIGFRSEIGPDRQRLLSNGD